MNKLTIWDSETGPESDERLTLLEPEFHAPSNWKDQDKIDEKVRELREEWREKAALSALTGRVLAIGYKDLDLETGEVGEPIIAHVEVPCDETERLVIHSLFDAYKESASGRTRLAGFSIHNFDLPFIMRRALFLRVPIPPTLFSNGTSRFYWPPSFVDLQKVWGFGESFPSGTLDQICRMFGIGEKTGSGGDFAKLYMNPATRSQALAYLNNDLDLTVGLAKRLLA